jgi:hypothetical protein
MNRCRYIKFGSKDTEIILRKKIRNYRRRTKELMAKLVQDGLDYKERRREEFEPESY